MEIGTNTTLSATDIIISATYISTTTTVVAPIPVIIFIPFFTEYDYRLSTSEITTEAINQGTTTTITTIEYTTDD